MFDEEIKKLNEETALNAPVYEKRTYTVPEIQDILGIGRNAAYKIVNSGAFKVVRVGGSIRISKKSFDIWLDEKDNQK